MLILISNFSWGQNSIYVNPSVSFKGDSTEYINIINTLDAFFSSKNKSYTDNIYWKTEDIKRYKYPYLSLYNQEISYKLKDSLHYRPTIIEILKINEASSYLVKIAYLGCEKNKFATIRFIYNMIITKDMGGMYKLKRATDYVTKDWIKYSTKSIDFFINPFRKLNKSDAIRLDSFNASIAKFLNVSVEKITYYSCINAKTLFEVRGFDYIPNMYYDSFGGQCESYCNTVYSGMNAEWYPHELVHIYTNKYFPNVNKVADEGFCTFMGGSYNLPLEYHLKIAKQYILKHPNEKLDDLLFNEKDIAEHTSSMYTLGGLICKMLYAKYGLDSIKEWLQVGNNEKKFYEVLKAKFNISKDQLHTFLYTELMKY